MMVFTDGARVAPRVIGGMLVALLLSGCFRGLHSNAERPQTYVLRAKSEVQGQTSPNAKTLRIGRTLVSPGLDSDRIALMSPDHRLDYYAASRWAAPVPQLVEALAVQTMRGTGAWAAVTDSQGAFPAEYFLQIAIQRFEADYTEAGAPKIHVVLNCSIGRSADRDLLANFVAEGDAVAGDNRLGPVVTAFEQAAHIALATVAERAIQAVNAPPVQP